MLTDFKDLKIKKNPTINEILIVGPNGNVGKSLIPELLRLGYKVRALEYRTKVPEQDGVTVYKGNTLDPDSLRKAVDGVDAICHLIRATGPGDTACEKWFNCCLRGAVNLLEAAKEVKLTRYITGSADNVFGHVTIPHYSPITETSPKRFADGYYGLFKIAEEELSRQYYLGFGIPLVIARFGWIWTNSFAENAAGALDCENRKIRKLFDRDGKPLIRHDVHIDDVIQGILLCLQKDEAVGQDFIFASPVPYSSSQLCEIVSKQYNYPVEEIKTDWYSWSLDFSKANSVLGYQPRVNVLKWLDSNLNKNNI